jgi:hypothetical protein
MVGGEMAEGNRHDLYISKTAWGELKQRAFIEGKTAGALIAFLLEWAVHNPNNVPDLSRYQTRSREIGADRCRRTVRGIPNMLWRDAKKMAQQGAVQVSISGLVEALLNQYLGLNMEEETSADEQPDNNQYQPETGQLQTGRVTFNLGKGAEEINLKQPRQ